MRKRLLGTLLLVSFLMIGCSKLSDEEEGGTQFLEISVSPSATYILPSPDVTKCYSSTITLSPNILEFSRIGFSWSSTNSSFRLLSITLQAKSPVLASNSYECNINGNELIALMPSRTIDAINAGDTAATISSTNFCSLRCGNIRIAEGANSATIPAKVKILGLETFTDGTTIPVTKEKDVTLYYKKFL